MPQSATLLPTSSRVIAWPSASSVASPFGSSLPNRVWSDVSRGYRYGFNGQEKDNEVSGEGNSYTAEFWQYDGRLGRRLNIDPINKSDLSGYYALHNCPIKYKDPNGDDDFFDNTGKFLFRTETGNLIKIVNSEIDKNGSVLISVKNLSDFNYGSDESSNQNKSMLKAVFLYYSEPLGVDNIDVGCSDGIDDNFILGYTRANDGKIFISTYNEKINALLNDINVMKSMIVHEKMHRDEDELARNLLHYRCNIAANSTQFYVLAPNSFRQQDHAGVVRNFNEMTQKKTKEGKLKYTTELIQSHIDIYNSSIENLNKKLPKSEQLDLLYIHESDDKSSRYVDAPHSVL